MKDFVRLTSINKLFKHRRFRNCLVLIVIITVPLILALSFSESMMTGITQKLIYLSGGHICVNDNTDFEQLEKFTEENVSVIYADSLILSKDSYSPLTVKGVSDDYFNGIRNDYLNLSSFSFKTKTGLLISNTTADQLNLKIGDTVTLIVFTDNQSTLKPIICNIEGIYNSGYKEIDSYIAYCSFDFAEKSFNLPKSTEFILKAEYAADLTSFIENLDSKNYTTWINRNSAIYENFINSRQMIMIILLVIELMTAFYFASVSNEFVQDDIEQISICKLLGANNILIFKTCYRSVLIVTSLGILAGTVTGCIISLLFTPLIRSISSLSLDIFSYYLLDFNMTIPYGKVLILVLFMLAVSAISIFISLGKTRKVTPLQLFNYKW